MRQWWDNNLANYNQEDTVYAPTNPPTRQTPSDGFIRLQVTVFDGSIGWVTETTALEGIVVITAIALSKKQKGGGGPIDSRSARGYEVSSQLSLIAAGGFAPGDGAAIDHSAIARQGAGVALVGDKHLPLAFAANIAVGIALGVGGTVGLSIEKGDAIAAGAGQSQLFCINCT